MKELRTTSLFLILLFIMIFASVSIAQYENQNREKKERKEEKEKKGINKSGQSKQKTFDSSMLVGNIVIGAPTANSILINVIVVNGMEAICEYGIERGNYKFKTDIKKSISGGPIEFELTNLKSDKQYFYRISLKREGESTFAGIGENSFHTARNMTSAFSFGVQGDSHPERAGKMFDHDLYLLTTTNAIKKKLDFYFMMGDDFSIDRLIQRNQLSQNTVDEVYLNQRRYLGLLGKQTPIFLVNGNHEQAARYLLDGTANNAAVYAGLARKKYFPLPVPNHYYSGNKEEIPNVGLPEDYYSFEWGNALFVVIDPYWHSEEAADNVPGDRNAGRRNRDLWKNTLGDKQYQWFKSTLKNSKAKFKFVFTHHVLGTGRGGVERATFFEWGGYNQKGEYEFEKKRPGWELPVHQLMAKNNVTIFFQGHDHLFCKQELDGVIYQSVPNPADNTYSAFNSESYKSGDVLPNSGFLNVSVSEQEVKVEYIRSFLSKDEKDERKNGMIAFSYTIK